MFIMLLEEHISFFFFHCCDLLFFHVTIYSTCFFRVQELGES